MNELVFVIWKVLENMNMAILYLISYFRSMQTAEFDVSTSQIDSTQRMNFLLNSNFIYRFKTREKVLKVILCLFVSIILGR